MLERFQDDAPGEMERRRKIAAARTIHGHAIAPKGSRERRTWQTWLNIHRRCEDPTHKDYFRYGGRGITVCPEWSDYTVFVAEMGLVSDNLTLDRRENSEGYFARNCRWASRQMQARNRRSSKLLCINGEVKTLAEWADISGVASSTIRMRITWGDPVNASLLNKAVVENSQARRERLERHAAEMRARNNGSVEYA